jgi:predicted nucleic acid-binding protein
MTGTPILPVGSDHSGVEIAAGSAEPSLGGILLDTTTLIDALRGRPAAVRIRELRTAGDRPYTCAINVEELFRGVKPGEEPSVSRLLNGLRLAPLGRIQGEQAGRWRRQFASRGVTLSQADCLVAAAAAGVGARLATGNPRDFPMKGLAVDHWPVGA